MNKPIEIAIEDIDLGTPAALSDSLKTRPSKMVEPYIVFSGKSLMIAIAIFVIKQKKV